MSDIKRFNSDKRLSRAVVHGNTVYLAGITADDRSKGMRAQTAEILAKIDALLKTAGTDKSKLVQTVIWLSDIRTVDEVNKVWDAWVVAGSAPARACVEARLQSPAKVIEIQATAARS